MVLVDRAAPKSKSAKGSSVVLYFASVSHSVRENLEMKSLWILLFVGEYSIIAFN